MAITFSGIVSDKILSDAFGFAIVPFQKGIAKIDTVIADIVTKRQTIDELTAENERLNERIDELINENTLLLQDKYELASLRELYDLDASYSQYEKVGARVISWDANNWFNSFIIDKGSRDDIKVNMNVIAGSGLVGRVTEVGYNWSRVTSIIDDTSNVSAVVLHTGDNLIVSGDMQLFNQGFIKYSQLLDSDNLVEKGDKIVTSYISDKYLPGILVGYITTVESDVNHITKSGFITPVVDFSGLSDVLIIKELKEEMDVELKTDLEELE